MLVHSCLFVLLSLLPHIDYIYTVLFEQINYDDDDDDDDILDNKFVVKPSLKILSHIKCVATLLFEIFALT